MNEPRDSYPTRPSTDSLADQQSPTPSAAAVTPQLPPTIGRYRVEAILGQGGFGLVYLAYDDQLQRAVAIKVPHGKRVSRPEDAEAYLTEARTVANLYPYEEGEDFPPGEDCPFCPFWKGKQGSRAK